MVGWGNIIESEDSVPPTTLQKAVLPIISNAQCTVAMKNYFIADSMMCAGNNGADTCQGDSGGPILIKENGNWIIAGVTSFGEGCNRPGNYGVYTRISHHLDFVETVLSPAHHIIPFFSLCLIALVATLFV